VIKNKKNKNKCPLCHNYFRTMKQLEAHCLNHHHKSYSDLIKITEQSIMTLGDFMNDGDEDEVQRGRITFGEQND